MARIGNAAMRPDGMARADYLWQRRGLLTLGPYGDQTSHFLWLQVFLV